jgi:hypothetical protein
MSHQDTSEFVVELEKQAKDFEERARFWESKEVIGLQIQAEGGTWKDISGNELASRLRWLAEEWRKIAGHVGESDQK